MIDLNGIFLKDFNTKNVVNNWQMNVKLLCMYYNVNLNLFKPIELTCEAIL